MLGNDNDLDGDSLTAVLVNTTTNGTLHLDLDGSFTYIPSPSFNGTDTFTYLANDGAGDANEATVNLTVNPTTDL